MKIDKILFSLSDHPDYQGFWELQSKIWKENIGIEPVCLFFAKDNNGYRPSTEHGTVIDFDIDPSVPWSLQLTMSKFHHPSTEPDTTWLIGDVDMLPLQTAYFTSHLADIGDDTFAHLNAGGIACSRFGDQAVFSNRGPHINGGCDLPGHYHVGKGRTFESVIGRGHTLREIVTEIVEADVHGMGPIAKGEGRQPETDDYWYYWCGEESRTSELIYDAIRNNGLQFSPSYYNNSHNVGRIDRAYYTPEGYHENRDMLRSGAFVDIHCARPFPKQAAQLQSILDEVWK